MHINDIPDARQFSIEGRRYWKVTSTDEDHVCVTTNDKGEYELVAFSYDGKVGTKPEEQQ